MNDPDARAEYRAARPDEYGDVLALWSAVFGSDDRDYFRAFLEGDPWRKEPYCQVARVDGRIVAAVYLCRRPMRLNGEPIHLGRIEAVATLPEYRRRGLSTELLRRTIDVMEAEDFAFSALNTGNHSHYMKHGFYRIPLPRYALTLDAAAPAPDADPDVQPLSVERWLEEAPAIYAAFSSTLPFSFERSPDYWNGWLRTRLEGAPRERLLLIGLRRRGDHDLVGYLLGDLPIRSGERVGIHEVAAMEPEGLARLYAEAVRAARSAGAPGLFGPHLNVTEEIMRSFGQLRIGESGTMHRRIHAADATMSEIDHCYQSGSACWWNSSDGY